MQLHTIARSSFSRRSRRIGRGGKRGTTAGRGTKGQKARAGAKIRPAIRDIIKKLPKLRGYRFRSFRPKPVAIALALIAARCPEGTVVTPQLLAEHGIVRRRAGRIPALKIVGSDPVKRKLAFRGVRFSAPARARVEEAGGSVAP